MAGIETKSFESPDETRTPEKASVAVVNLGSVTAGRLTAQPGWKWSECVKPIVGGDSCQARHVGAVQSGKLHIEHNDGTQVDVGPGDAYVIEPGHDAWVIGEEAYVAFEFESETAQNYASS